MPSATQNKLNKQEAEMLVKNGIVANMPSTPEVVNLFIKAGVLFGAGKDANAGDVATS